MPERSPIEQHQPNVAIMPIPQQISPLLRQPTTKLALQLRGLGFLGPIPKDVQVMAQQAHMQAATLPT